jgi:ectoine hydroxylase-related dioxygenase (phytanoyl-CoA dioxygenase family)
MVPIDLKAGDLLIWHHGLPHRTGPNLTDEVRLVLYLSMAPARQNEQERLERVRAWRDRLPGASLFEGDPLRREERHGVTAELTHLGQRLLGAQPWPLEEG